MTWLKRRVCNLQLLPLNLLITLLACHCLATKALAVDIVETRWGFNGKVALSRFNLLSVLVNNSTPQPFEGFITLRKTQGGVNHVDATIVEPLTILPGTQKWVQFYPYINTGWGNTATSEVWQLSFGRGQKEEVPIPRVAKYQRIILDNAGSPGSRAGILRPMQANLFPPFVSATDALQVVAMDHEPKPMTPSQKEALLDWLHLGGTVLLMAGPAGKLPEFEGPLAVLNSPLDEFRYGSGRVIKTPFQRGQFSDQQARQLFASLPKNPVWANQTQNDPQDPQDAIDGVDGVGQNQPGMTNNYSDGTDPFAASSFLSQLKEMTKPDHNWVLLHMMFWVYIGMVFPGCYLLGKRWSDFRIVYGGLLGTVALFSFLFSVVGQRGYGEATAVHSVAIARSLKDGGLDVSSWSNVFVTGGATYSIKHNARGVLYSTCSETEEINGRINNGMEAEFIADIPPFSNREFALRMRLASGSPTVHVDSFNTADGRLQELSLTVDGVSSNETQAHALFGDRFYALTFRNGKWKLGADVGDAATMLNMQNMHNWPNNNRGYGYPYGENVTTAKERFNLMSRPLLSRSLNVSRENEIRQVQISTDIIRVLFYTKMPASFAVQNDRLGAQDGYVLYSIDVPLLQEK